jgi:hypothetical protein
MNMKQARKAYVAAHTTKVVPATYGEGGTVERKRQRHRIEAKGSFRAWARARFSITNRDATPTSQKLRAILG